MPLEHDVITSQHIASFVAVIQQVDKSLQSVTTKANGIAYFKKKEKAFLTTKKALVARIKKLETGIGTLRRDDNSVTSLIDDLKAFKKEVDTVSKQSHTMVYLFGKSKVKSAGALESKVKSELPQKCQSNASQAVNDAVGGKGKDASKAGSGMLHASAGKPGVSSCTIFFTRTEELDGLETHITIEAVGSHEGSKSYNIHWSNVSKLKAGTTFSL